ncbi:MAG: hypothetical protein ACM3O7_00010 [Acidobacteriota bacterium]
MTRSGQIDPPQLWVPRLNRRRFMAGMGAAGMGAAAVAAQPAQATRHLLRGSSRYPTPQPGQTYYTKRHDLPQTRSAKGLATWMETEHLDYTLGGWFFFGRLVDQSNPSAIAACAVALQQIAVGLPGGGWGGGVALHPRSQRRYEFAFMSGEAPNRVVVKSDPWGAALYSPDQTAPLLALRAVSGRMGEVDAVYLLEADIPAGTDPRQPDRMQAEVRLRDRFGVINQGYGATAFCPQYLTERQRRKIERSHGGSVRKYLNRTGDPMINQGSWYYQLPFLDVERFSVAVGKRIRSRGGSGLMLDGSARPDP